METRTQQLEQAGLIDASVDQATRQRLEDLLTEDDVQGLQALKATTKSSGSSRPGTGECTRSGPSD